MCSFLATLEFRPQSDICLTFSTYVIIGVLGSLRGAEESIFPYQLSRATRCICSFRSISQVERTAGQSIGNGRQRAARLSRILSLSLEPSLPPRLQSLSYVQRRFSAVTTKIPSKLDARVVATLRSRRISLVSTIYKPRRERSAPAPFLSTYLQPSPKLWVLKHSRIVGLKALHIQ